VFTGEPVYSTNYSLTVGKRGAVPEWRFYLSQWSASFLPTNACAPLLRNLMAV